MNRPTRLARIASQTATALACCGLCLLLAELSACDGGGDPLAPAETVNSAELSLTADCRDPALIRLATGTVRGHVESTCRQFLGIPYAAPPTGSLRWKPPMPAPSWTGVRDATVDRNICPQLVYDVSAQNPPTPSNPPPARVVGDEDCLVLNVTTPNRPNMAKLPVMVWIHGGDYVVGEGNSEDPRLFAEKGNVIFVSINYRLGALGYLAHPALSAESRDSSGNFGLLDQQAAFAWVKANIAQFGGDPTNVTIAGQSAGGNSVWANVVSPRAAGLFQRAISMSGLWSSNWNWLGWDSPAPLFQLSDAEATGMQFASDITCGGSDGNAAACLRNAPVTDLVNAGGGGVGPVFYKWGPVAGGRLLPRPFAEALAQGAFNRVPIMNGSTHDESTFTVMMDFWLYMNSPLSTDSYPQALAQRFGDDASLVLAHYPVETYGTPAYAYSAVDTDSQFSCMTRSFNRLAAAYTAVYAYEFRDPDPPSDGWEVIFGGALPFSPRAYHASDLQYVFRKPSTSLTSAQLALSKHMIDYFANFARFGAPLGHPAWSAYSRSYDAVQSLAPDAVGPVKNFAADHQCKLWKQLLGI
jgi:para-nitrobenzyl esterase